MARCPQCGKSKKTKMEIVEHIQDVHIKDIPEGWSAAQYYYALHHDGRPYGLCRVCGKPTPWNEEAGKPSQLCGDPACRQKMREMATANMLRVYGKTHLLDDPDHQKKMLSNRKISGTYKYSNGKHEFTYTGSYELQAIKFIDTVLNLDPAKIQMPGPIVPYEYNGETKFWITDIYLEDFNLIIEVKDGGTNKNTHPGFSYNREIEELKDNVMMNQSEFNYIKVTDKNMLPLIKILALIRNEQITSEKGKVEKPLIVINESVGIVDTNSGTQKSEAYVLLYGPRNMTGIYEGAAISMTPDLENLSIIKNDVLVKTTKDDQLLKNKSGVLLKFVGDADFKSLGDYLDHEYDIDPDVVPDGMHMVREVLKASGYKLTDEPVVTPTTILSSNDFKPMQTIENIPDYDYCSAMESIMQESAEAEATEEYQSILNEAYIFNRQDIQINTQYWQRGTRNNLLFIIGLSGAGKSTTAINLTREYGAIYVELDLLDYSSTMLGYKLNHTGYDLMVKYVTEVAPHLQYADLYKSDNDTYMAELFNFYDWLFGHIFNDLDNLYIVEGIQLLYIEPDLLSNKPLLIKGTSVLTSIQRRLKRAGTNKELRQGVIKLLQWYNTIEKKLNMLRKVVGYKNKLLQEEEAKEREYTVVFSESADDSMFVEPVATFAHDGIETIFQLQDEDGMWTDNVPDVTRDGGLTSNFSAGENEPEMDSLGLTINEATGISDEEQVDEPVKKFSWKDRLFGRIKSKIKSIAAVFSKVTVNNEAGTIEVRGISYDRLISRIKELYKDQGIEKLFDKEYKIVDMILYNKKKIRKNKMRIDYLYTYTFFALELIVLFEELHAKYNDSSYKKIANELYEKTWVSSVDGTDAKDVDLYALTNIKLELKEYQKEFIRNYNTLKTKLNMNGYILSLDQGLGKTLTSVSLAECLGKKRVYIVCPNSLKENWALEIKSYFEKYSDIEKWKSEVFIIDYPGHSYNEDTTKYIIVNQESIPKMFNYIDTSDNILIIDESHNFRNMEAKRVADLLDLRDKLNCKDVLLMSGTPIKATPNEIVPSLLLIDPLFTVEVAKIYNKCFNLDNMIASDIIKKRFGNIMYRKTKDEVLTLPHKNEEKLILDIKDSDRYLMENVRRLIVERFNQIYSERLKENDKLRAEFFELVKKYSSASASETKKYMDFIAETTNKQNVFIDEHELDIEFYDSFINTYVTPNIKSPVDSERLPFLITNFLRMKQSSMGRAVGEILPKYRTKMFIELYMDNKQKLITMIKGNGAKKTVIFSPIVEVINAIYDDLSYNGINCVKVTGETKNRMDSILAFKEEDSVDVLLATTQTLGTGVTLTEANLMFFFGTPWRASDYDQCADRIYRIGQETNVNIYTVLLNTGRKMNLSTRMQDILEWSDKMFNNVIKSTDHLISQDQFEENVINESVAEELFPMLEAVGYQNKDNAVVASDDIPADTNLGIAFKIVNGRWRIIGPGKFIKHSVNPNVEIVEDNDEEISLKAIDDIKKDSELTLDFESLPKRCKNKVLKIKKNRKKRENAVKFSLTPEEREQVKQRFGEVKCSFARTDKGKYYCYTHRCRTKDYDSISQIPISKVRFIETTG